MLKGLVLKDIYSVRFQIIIALMIMLLPNIAALFFTADDPASNAMSDLIMIFLHSALNYVNICIFSSFVLNTLDDEANSGWHNIVRTFPVSRGAITGAKFVSSGIIVAVLTAVSLVFNVIACVKNGLPAEPMITVPLCIGVVQMGILCPAFPLAQKFGTKRTHAIYLALEILAAVAAVVLLAVSLDRDDAFVFMRAVFYAGAFTAAGASVWLSYLAGRKISE